MLPGIAQPCAAQHPVFETAIKMNNPLNSPTDQSLVCIAHTSIHRPIASRKKRGKFQLVNILCFNIFILRIW